MPSVEAWREWLDHGLRLGTLSLAALAEAAGALIIGVAVVRGLWAFLTQVAVDRRGEVPKEAIRLTLGRSLALALEFELGADILRTAVAPGWTEIGQLAAIAVIRTALNYFLQRELDAAALRAEAPPAEAPPPGPRRVIPPTAVSPPEAGLTAPGHRAPTPGDRGAASPGSGSSGGS